MAENTLGQITTGQYEVILRKKYELNKGEKNTPLVPYFTRFANSTKGKNEAYHTMMMHMEIRKDILEHETKEISGKRFTGQFPFIKVTELIGEGETDAPLVKQDAPAKKFIKDLYNAVGAETSFTAIDFKEFLIDKPVLVTINVEPDKGYGVSYILKSVEKTKQPDIQPSALIDELDTLNDSIDIEDSTVYDF